MDGTDAAAGRNSGNARICHRYHGFVFDIAYHLHLEAERNVLFVREGDEHFGHRLHRCGLPYGERLPCSGQVAYQQMVLFVGCYGSRRHRTADLDFSAVGSNHFVIVARRAAVADVHDQVGIYHTHGNVRHRIVRRESHVRRGTEIEQGLEAGGIQAEVYLFRNVLDYQVFGFGDTVVGRYGESEAFVVIVGLSRIRRNRCVGRHHRGSFRHRKVFCGDERNRLRHFVYDSVERRSLEGEGNKFAFVRLDPFSRDDYGFRSARGIGVGKFIVFSEVQHGKRRIYLAVGRERSPHAHPQHIRSGDIVRCLREEPRNGDDVTVDVGVRHFQAAHLLVGIWAGSEVRSERSYPLTVSRWGHIFRFLACCRQQQHRYEYAECLFHDQFHSGYCEMRAFEFNSPSGMGKRYIFSGKLRSLSSTET